MKNLKMQNSKKPNILILHADQHRQDCIGAYGNKDVQTPAIDSLANDGVKYSNHFTVYPVCTPARYSMLSGMYVHKHNAWSNEATLPTGYKTFPQILRDNGYHTACVGKMHMTPTYHDVGYDTMLLAEQNGQGRYEDDYHTYLMENGLIDAIDLTDQVDEVRKSAKREYYDHFGAFQSDLEEKYHSTSFITQKALDELKNWSDTGNLLAVDYIKPHHPFDPPAPYSTMYNPDELTLLEGYTESIVPCDGTGNAFFDYRTLTKEKLLRIMANYYGTITQIDDNIALILDYLKENGLYDDTLIIYTSDHGEYMGFHHMLLKGNFLYDPLAKIPLIIKYPKQMELKGENDNLSENIDISATILACCSLQMQQTMSGIDISNPNNGREYAFSEGQYGTNENPIFGYMIRSKKYKLIVHGSFTNAMFFDMEADKSELNNLIDKKELQGIIAEHKNFLINKLLFPQNSNNHCDLNAPTTIKKEVTDKRSETLQAFIKEKLNKS